jgi:hypothetical protein
MKFISKMKCISGAFQFDFTIQECFLGILWIFHRNFFSISTSGREKKSLEKCHKGLKHKINTSLIIYGNHHHTKNNGKSHKFPTLSSSTST